MSEQHTTINTTSADAVATYLTALTDLAGFQDESSELDAATAELERVRRKANLKKNASDPLLRLSFLQQATDLESRVKSLGKVAGQITEREKAVEAALPGFVAHAKSYGEKHGITVTTWKRFGVPFQVLKQAGISGQ